MDCEQEILTTKTRPPKGFLFSAVAVVNGLIVWQVILPLRPLVVNKYCSQFKERRGFVKEREKIRYRLSVNHLSFAWLIDMLRKRGIETNGPVLSAILAGTRNGPSVDKIIAESIDILDWYERQIGGVS